MLRCIQVSVSVSLRCVAVVGFRTCTVAEDVDGHCSALMLDAVSTLLLVTIWNIPNHLFWHIEHIVHWLSSIQFTHPTQFLSPTLLVMSSFLHRTASTTILQTVAFNLSTKSTCFKASKRTCNSFHADPVPKLPMRQFPNVWASASTPWSNESIGIQLSAIVT